MGKLLIFVISLCSTLQVYSQESNITGTWLTEDEEAHVKIFKKDGKYFGKIVWLQSPNDKNGIPIKDEKNPNESLKTRPILNLILMWEFVYDQDKREYIEGKVYDPDDGKTYSGKMWIEKQHELKMRGYWGWLYSTETWKRIK